MKNLKSGNNIFAIMETDFEKQMGLQYVESLPFNKVLIFSNIKPGTIFHSKNCRFPIEIISVDNNSIILDIDILNMNSTKNISNNASIVIEANVGWSRFNNLVVGKKYLL